MAFLHTSPRVCWICGKTLGSEGCTIDEYGIPVHNECYALLIAWRFLWQKKGKKEGP
jgi:hypothetical protein